MCGTFLPPKAIVPRAAAHSLLVAEHFPDEFTCAESDFVQSFIFVNGRRVAASAAVVIAPISPGRRLSRPRAPTNHPQRQRLVSARPEKMNYSGFIFNADGNITFTLAEFRVRSRDA